MASFSEAKDKVVTQFKEHKLPVIAILGIIVVGVGFSMTRTTTTNIPQSNVGGTADVHANLDKMGVVNNAYKHAIKVDDEQKRQEAEDAKKSFVPTFMNNHFEKTLPIKIDDPNAKPGDASDKPPELPPVELPKVEEEKPKPPPVVKKVVEHHYYSEAEKEDYSKKMEGIVASMDNFKPGAVYASSSTVSQPVAEIASVGAGLHAGEHESLASSNSSGSSDEVSFIMPDPGTVLHGHFLSQLDSRYPGSVLGMVDGGAYNGARLMGNFQAMNDKLMIKFSSMTVVYSEDGDKKTKPLKINAVAVDPDTLSEGMADYVNKHLLAKIGFQMATSFMSGLGSAIQQSGSTAMMSPSGGSVISEGVKSTQQQMLQAGGTTASQIGNTLQSEFGNKPDTIKVFQNKPFGLLFLDATN